MRKLQFLVTILLTAGAFCASSQTINTVAGNGTAGFSGDTGPATAAEINNPYGVAVDNTGNVYFTDYANHRIRKISTTGVVTTIAGNGTGTYSGDGGPATDASIQFPRGIAVDPGGNIIFSDYGNNRVRMINTTTGYISTIAGVGGGPSFAGDGGPATAAHLGNTWGVCFGQAGDIFLADNLNCRVRKINAAGIISTSAGTGSCFIGGDGGAATAALVQYPTGVALDATGKLYIADDGNNRVRVINTAGVISTVTGSATYGFTGDGGAATAARTYNPRAIATDNVGNVYLCDMNNFRIRKINSSGVITTIAGSGAGTSTGGTGGYSGDGGPATSAQMSHITGVAVHPSGRIYISDNDNNRIRVINSSHSPSFTSGHLQFLTTCMSTVAHLDTLLAISDIDAGDTETWGVVLSPTHGTLSVSYSTTSTGGVVYPAGLTYTPTAGYTGIDSFRCSVSDGTASDTTNIRVTVNSAPSAGVISGVSSVCMGATATMTETVTGGTWSCTNSLATVSGGVVTGVSAGIDTVLYTVTSACGTSVAMHIITISSMPSAGVITGVSSLCEGETVTMSESVTGGVWTVSNAHATVTSGGLVTGVSAGVDSVIYSVTNACGTARAIRVVTINAAPSAGSISGASNVCVGASITLTVFATGGVWSSSNANATVAGGVVTGVTGGTDSIKYTVTNSCGTAFSYLIITINPLPAAGTIAGADSVCPGDSILLTRSGGTGGSGAWKSSDTTVAKVSVTGWVKGLVTGPSIIKYVITNSCGSDSSTHAVFVRPHSECSEEVGAQIGGIGYNAELFPNPNSGNFTFVLSSPINEEVRLSLTDVTGRVVGTFTVSSNRRAEIEFNQPSGVYFLSVMGQGYRYTTRVVVLK